MLQNNTSNITLQFYGTPIGHTGLLPQNLRYPKRNFLEACCVIRKVKVWTQVQGGMAKCKLNVHAN